MKRATPPGTSNLPEQGRCAQMLCSESIAVNLGPNAARAVTLKCRSWGCPLCQPERQTQLIAQARNGKPTTFITLTSNPETGGTPASRARALAHAWPIIVKRACKRWGYKAIPYFCVFEATKRGEPHLHILARVKWIDQRWLSDQMRSLVNAPIVDIRQVKSGKHVAKYIAKYIGKEPHRFASCKRYWCTRSWRLVKWEPEDPDVEWYDGWQIQPCTLATKENYWRDQAGTCERIGKILYWRGEPPPPKYNRGRLQKSEQAYA